MRYGTDVASFHTPVKWKANVSNVSLYVIPVFDLTLSPVHEAYPNVAGENPGSWLAPNAYNPKCVPVIIESVERWRTMTAVEMVPKSTQGPSDARKLRV